MAGYSATPLPRKLGIQEGHRVAFVGAPPGFADALGALPEDVTVLAPPTGPLDVVVVFTAWEAELVGEVARLRPLLRPNGGIWLAWPKKASKRPTDITEDRLRALFLPTGLVDNKVCAIDAVWAGLRFVLRRELRGPA